MVTKLDHMMLKIRQSHTKVLYIHMHTHTLTHTHTHIHLYAHYTCTHTPTRIYTRKHIYSYMLVFNQYFIYLMSGFSSVIFPSVYLNYNF